MKIGDWIYKHMLAISWLCAMVTGLILLLYLVEFR